MNKQLSRRHAWLTLNGGRCNLRGVLKIALPKWPQSVSYHMAVDNSTLFSLNIGESLTNNAWGNGRWEEGSKEVWGKEGGYKRRVGGREGRREGWREGGKEGGREGGRDGGGGREQGDGGGGREGGREQRKGGRKR